MTAEFARALDQAAEVLARNGERIRDALAERGVDFDDVIEFAEGGRYEPDGFAFYCGALGASVLVGTFLGGGR